MVHRTSCAGRPPVQTMTGNTDGGVSMVEDGGKGGDPLHGP